MMVFTPRLTDYPANRTADAIEHLAKALDDNGRLPVDAAGVTLTADVIDVDMEAITGSGAAAKTLADVHSALAIPTAITGGTKTVAAAATPEALVASSTPCKAVWIGARCDADGNPLNTKPVFIGDVNGQNIPILPSTLTGIVIRIDDAAKLYVKVGANGSGVVYRILV